MRTLPRGDMKDMNYRRSMFIRYADDFVFLLQGSKAEALVIKEDITNFLLKFTGLELNADKTLVTHITEGFHFLGAFVKMQRRVGFMMKNRTTTGKHITMRANIRANVCMPTKLLIEKLIKAGFARRNHRDVLLAKPMTKLVNLDHSTIVQFYNSKIHGLLNYYSFASNRIEIQNLI
jgi:retron-type reverse transcriptase